MPTPQPGIFALGHRSLHHLQLDLEHGASAEDLRAAIARIGDLSAMVFGSAWSSGSPPTCGSS